MGWTGRSALPSVAVVMALLAVSSVAMTPGNTGTKKHPGIGLTEKPAAEPAGPMLPVSDGPVLSATTPSVFGHPRQEDIDAILGAMPRLAPLVQLPNSPPDAPLVSGSFINFESPATKPVALSSSGNLLFVTNTPNNRLEIYDTTTPTLTKLTTVNVGLDPVAVAVQPGTSDRIVWVANHISDTVSIIDLTTLTVIGAVEVGDEPVNILFNAAGTYAFVVIQGAAAVPDPAAPATINVQEGAVVAVSTTPPFDIVRTRYLDMNTPRAAVYDAATDHLIVAALHSGNNTTVVGEPERFQLVPPQGACCLGGGACAGLDEFACSTAGGQWLGANTACATSTCPGVIIPTPPPADPCLCSCVCVSFPSLFVAPIFTGTFAPTPGSIFNGGALAPYPDPWVGNPGGPPSPLVLRIVEDAGVGSGPWTSFVASILNGGAVPDSVRVTDFQNQFNVINGLSVLSEIANDAKDTADHDIAVIDTSTPAAPNGMAITSRLGNIGTTLTGMARNPVTGDVYVSNLEPRNLERTEPTLKGRFMKHELVVISNIYGATPAIQRLDLHGTLPTFDNVSSPNPAAQAISLAYPMDLAVSANGRVIYLGAFGVGRVASIDAPSLTVLGRIDVGDGTRGLVLDDPRGRLYAFNRTSMTVTDLRVSVPASMTISQQLSLFNPEPAVITNGRTFLYSTKFSNNYGSSCGMCHIDGNLDHLAWDLGDPTAPALLHTPFLSGITPCGGSPANENHPVKGPMITQSLKGLFDHTELHWRGDKPTFNDFNGAFVSLLGGRQLSTAKMQAFTDFINTVVYPPSYYRTHDNQFKNAAAGNGRAHFINNCDQCHMLSHDGAMEDICIIDGDDGAFNLNGLFAQVQMVPQLRAIQKKFNSDRYNGFGLLHDGREEREANSHPLETFLQTFFPGISTAPAKDEIIGFITAFQSNVMPVVGWQVMWDDPSMTGQDMLDIQKMIAEHSLTPSRCDVVLKAQVGGVIHGGVLTSLTPPMFLSDFGVTYDLPTLSAVVASGTPIVVTAVPPGSGVRIGIDQDLDGILDASDPTP